MFSGPSAGGLQAGPTAGAITTNPAAYIPTDGLAIAQIDQLRGELAQKHPLLSAAAPLGQNLVASLSSDLAARATTTAVAAGLAQKQDVIAENSLPQSRVVGLVADLAAKATSTALASGLGQKQDVIAENSLPQSRVFGLVADLAAKASSDALATIAKTAGLQEALNDKPRAIDVSHALNSKQATLTATSIVNVGQMYVAQYMGIGNISATSRT